MEIKVDENNQPIGIILDGEELDESKIVNLKNKEKDLVSGYQQKYRELATERKQLEDERAGLLGDGAKRVDDLMGFGDGNNNAIIEEIKSLRNEVKVLKENSGNITKTLTNEKVISTRNLVDELVEKKYPFASSVDCKDKLVSFYEYNNRFPTKDEVEGIVKKEHDKIVQHRTEATKGMKIVDENNNVVEGKKIPNPSENAPKEEVVKVPTLENLDMSIQAGQEFFKKRQDLRLKGK